MGMQPKIQTKANFLTKQCTVCGGRFGVESFSPTSSLFYPDSYIPICNDCIGNIIRNEGESWEIVNKICQYADIPFVPNEWERIKEMNSGDMAQTFAAYSRVFQSEEFIGLDWNTYYQEFKALEAAGLIEAELPLLDEARKRRLEEKWGGNYSDEEFGYLENLYNGLTTTQNVNGALQTDQALKICKISLELDSRIREGSDYDKLLTSYDKLVKIAEFTPKNVKNINDFDSIGEVFKWCEKRGWHNKFYDDVTRDIVDETIKNYQNFVQRLYINETGIGDEITRRIEALKSVEEGDDIYGINNTNEDLDLYEHKGYEDLMGEEDFMTDLEGDIIG